MFIREKNINGQKYGYLVENTWNNGKIKQQVKKYLGKIIDEGETETATGNQLSRDKNTRQATDVGLEIQEERRKIQDLRHETWEFIQDILRQHLEEKGYKTTGDERQVPDETVNSLQFTKENTTVNLNTGEVTHKGKPAVIKINQGHITKNTMTEARGQTGNQATNNIQEFAKAIIHLGINTTQETILRLYEMQEERSKNQEEEGKMKEVVKTFYY